MSSKNLNPSIINKMTSVSIRNETVKNIIYSSKYKQLRVKYREIKNKLYSACVKIASDYYTLSEEERMLVDVITELFY